MERTKSNLTKAFRALRKKGYFAKQNFMCCQSCGCAAIPEENEKKYVFYHSQDNDDLRQYGYCYLAWSGDGKEIVETLEAEGIKVDWKGSNEKRIKITVK